MIMCQTLLDTKGIIHPYDLRKIPKGQRELELDVITGSRNFPGNWRWHQKPLCLLEFHHCTCFTVLQSSAVVT